MNTILNVSGKIFEINKDILLKIPYFIICLIYVMIPMKLYL